MSDSIPPHDEHLIKNFLTVFEDSEYSEPRNYKKAQIQVSSKEQFFENCPISQGSKSDPFYLKKIRKQAKFENKEQNIHVIRDMRSANNYMDDSEEQDPSMKDCQKSKSLTINKIESLTFL